MKTRPGPLFFKTDLCSATSIESSRRDLLNHTGMVEHRSILTNNQKTLYPGLIFTPRHSRPKTGFCYVHFRLSNHIFYVVRSADIFNEELNALHG